MSNPQSHEVTQLLNQIRAGNDRSAEQLMAMIYTDLRRLAGGYMRSERSGHTLQPTALVHEAYMKIFGSEKVEWQNRAHFFAVAARQMRRILVDHAREQRADKRGGGAPKVALDDANGLAERREEDLVELDEALDRLEKLDEKASRVVELKFFSGLTDKETAEVLGSNVAAVRRDWEFAKAWLFSQLGGS